MDPDPGHFFKIYWIFLSKNNYQIFCYIFFAYFYSKTWWTIQKWGNFYNLSFFSKVQNWVLGVKKLFVFFSIFWSIFYPLDLDPWIRIFLRIRIQEAKILRIQRIRILSSAIVILLWFRIGTILRKRKAILDLFHYYLILDSFWHFSMFIVHHHNYSWTRIRI